ncbi:MAG: C25 family cysteine peptidase, partial [Candidatus Edwardsbacteria bacterium]|nr:C25 family cysteine peptidase [Candidatus Edwardsbacteria bacterium]
MSGRKFAALFVAVSLLAGVALAAADIGWIAVNSRSNQKAEVKLLGQARGALTITASLPGLERALMPVGLTGAKDEAFTQLTIPGYAHTGELGKPKLPMLTAVLDVPVGATVSASVVDGDYREYRLSDLGIDARIVPALPSVPKVAGAVPQFVLDQAAYASDAMYPGKLTDVADDSKEAGLARGHRLVTVRLYPVQYNPASGMLRVYSDIKADVRISGGDYAKSAKLVRQDYSRDWESFIQRMVLNYDPSLYGAKDSLLNLPIYYDIYYGASFASAAQRLADWKTQKGYKVRINDAGGWTAARVNDSIRLRSPKATYVAVISDPNAVGSDIVPASATGGSSADQTDLYYAETDESGYLPDLFNARISVKTAAEAGIAIDKLINYEKAEFGSAGTAWLKKATLTAGYDGSYQWLGIATNEYCRQILAREGYTTIDTLILGSSEGKARIVAGVNAGRAWTIYTAHGGQTCWCTSPYWYANQLNGDLTNQDMYTFPIGHCCLAGDYQYSEDCFAETWPKLANKGSVTYFGSVPSTYWDEDDWLQRRYFDAIYDSIPGTPNLKINETGRFTQWGLYWIQNNTATSRKQYYFEAYHVFNDPSQDFWTDVPHALTVAHAPSVAPMSGTFAVNVKEGGTNIAGALVCGWVKNRAGEHWSAYTDASGNVTLPAAPSTAGDTMLVTVTKHNFDPYEGQALVIVPAVVTIEPDTIPVLTATPVTVTVLEPGSGSPVPNVAVTISGLGVTPALADTTDGSGVASFNVFPMFGEVLTVRGREVGESYDMFTGSIWVTGAASFTSADVSVSVPDLGLSNVLTPDYEALFDASCDPADFALLVSGCGLDLTANTAGGSLQAPGTPTAVGTVTANIVKGGYNVYTETFPCRIVYGTLAGQVTEVGPGTPVAGVALGGWVSGADTTATPAAFHLTTDGSGNYAVPDSLVVGRYDIYATKFGYIGQLETPMVVYGPNTYNFAITAAPSGDVSGAVTESGTGIPLAATVSVYRSDDNSLYATTATDSAAGGTYSVTGLPYFNYRFEVR